MKENEMLEMQSIDWLRGISGDESRKISIQNFKKNIGITCEEVLIRTKCECTIPWKTGLYILKANINPGLLLALFGDNNRCDIKPIEVCNCTSGAIVINNAASPYLNVDVKENGLINIHNNNNETNIILTTVCLSF